MTAVNTTKHSFADLVMSQKAAKHNSDLANLAVAVTQIDADIASLMNLRDEVHSLAANIELGKVVDLKEVKRLYDLATGKSRLVTL